MRRRFLSLALLVSLAAVLGSCANGEPGPLFGRGRIRIRGEQGPAVALDVQVTATREARARGLMGRTDLPENAGMAFLFEQPTTSAFWMRDTRIPLSIAFWDADRRIVAILDMQPCPAETCPVYRPNLSYVGAVEANQGYFDEHGVGTGDHVEFRPTP